MTLLTSSLLATEIDTPVGRLALFAGDAGIETIAWGDRIDDHRFGQRPVVVDAAPPGAASAGDELTGPQRSLSQLITQLEEYFAGERTTFDVPLAPRGTEFQLAVWHALREIPYGTTISYGEQARRLGDVNKARAVGAANGRNPLPIVVPCHRVVGSDGSLTGFGGGMDNKRWLLTHEQGEIRLF